MVHAAHVNRATARFILRSGSAASKGSSATPPSTRHFLIVSAKLLETELTPSVPSPNAFRIANICPTFFSPAPLRAFLIGTAIRLKSDLTHSQQTRKHFLIGTIGPTLAPAPLCTHHSSLITPHCLTPFLFDTNKPHKIIILVSVPMKTKEKPLSIQYKFAVRGTCNLACASFSRTHELQRNDVASKRTARPSLPRRSAHNA